MREARKINNQVKTSQGILNSVRHIDSVNSYRIVFKIYYTVKRNYYIFGIRERTGFARLKRIIIIKVSL